LAVGSAGVRTCLHKLAANCPQLATTQLRTKGNRAKRKRLKPDCSGLTHIGPLVYNGGSPLLMLIFELSIYPKLFKHCLATADRRRANVSVCVAMSHLSSVVSENQFNVENGQFLIK